MRDGMEMFLPLAQQHAGGRECVATRQSFEATCPTQLHAKPQPQSHCSKCHDNYTDLFKLLLTPTFRLLHALLLLFPDVVSLFPPPPFYSLLNRSSDWVSLSVPVSFCPPCSTHLMSAESIIDDPRGLAVTGCLHRLSQGESGNAPGPDTAAGLQ